MPRKRQTKPQELTQTEVALEMKMAKVYNNIDINKPIPAEYNPREEVEPGTRLWNELEASLKEFGFADPLVVNSDWTLIGGHQRLKVAKAMGFTKCIVSMVDVDKDREKALNIALNKITGNWKEIQLADLLKQIKGSVSAEAMGFNQAEMEAAMNKAAGDVKDDNFDVETELKRPAFAKKGDLWLCGQHRIVCGDSTLPETFELLMDGKKANLLLTDPPYLVAYENASGSIENDALDDEAGYKFLEAAFERFRENLAEESACYVFYATSKSRVFYDAFEDAGFRVSCGLIWRKDRLVLSRTDYQQNFEPIIYGWKKDGKHAWYGDRKQTTCFDFDRPANSKKEGWGHPTQKPVPLMAYLIRQSTMENGIVLDGFHGSGSTMVACNELNRIAYAVELDERFVSVQVLRYIFSCRNGDYDDVFCIRNGQRLTFDEAVQEAGAKIVHAEEEGGHPEIIYHRP